MQLAEQLLRAIRERALIRPGDHVASAVSGGADSVALLLLLLELRDQLGIVLSAAHVNHKLRGDESEADQRFVEELCRSHSLHLHCRSAPLEQPAKSGIEAAARELRYAVFRDLASANRGMKIATGHTLDDQAETVLLRILRGTGIRGLAGIHPRVVLKQQGRVLGEVVRPLLSFRRAELQDFLREHGQTWREDSTNRESVFLRNRVRNVLLSTLKENFGDAVVENLADLAEIARAEEEHWVCSHPETCAQAGELNVAALLAMPLASQRRLVRTWIEGQAAEASVSFRMIEEILALARSESGKMLEITSVKRIRRTREGLCFAAREAKPGSGEYEYSMSIPGRVEIPELNIRLAAAIAEMKDIPDCERHYLLDPERLPPVLTVRNWRPGDRFWPAHTKEPRKVKHLLNDRHIVGPEKKLWPVLVAGNEVVWMRGFPVPEKFCPRSGRAVLLAEIRGTHSLVRR